MQKLCEISNALWKRDMVPKPELDLMQMFDLNETMDHLAKANSFRWYGHVQGKDRNNFQRRA